jgi:hypothetical protein
MSRLSVIQNRYLNDYELCHDLKLMMIRSINIVLKQFPNIDNIIFCADGGSWRNKVEVPKFLQSEGIEYKGTRVRSEDFNWELLFSSYDDFVATLNNCGITACREIGIEGDDWCYHWSNLLNSQGTNCIIWTKDKDLTQLVKMDKDKCFTVWWNKDSGVITSDTSEDNIKKLRQIFLTLPIVDFNEMANILYQLPYFSRMTLEDYTGLSKDDLKMLLKFMTNQHLVDKVKGDYRRLPLGTELLENLVNNPITKQEIDTARKNFYSNTDV